MDKYFRIKTLIKTLANYDKIIIYGTGQIAQNIYPYLIQYGIKDKIHCFTQTDKCEKEMLEGIPVFQIYELNCNTADCAVLIAASERYVDEIRKTADEQGFIHIISLTDYRIPTDQDFLKLNTFDEYCRSIAQWYAEQYELSDMFSFMKKLYDRGSSAYENLSLIHI